MKLNSYKTILILAALAVASLACSLVSRLLPAPIPAGPSPIQTATFLTRPNVNRNSTGAPDAPVKMSEFLDYQCPFCQEFWQQTEPQIINAYVKTGKVLLTDRSAGNWVSNNIGQGSTESQDAAQAAYCAADQNKFWEMHDALFSAVLGEDAGSFTGPRLQAIAQSVGLDMNAYDSCFSGAKYMDLVNQDLKDARAAKIEGTPFFVISYIPKGQTQTVTVTVSGAQPFRVFQQALDQALANAGAQ